ARAGRGADSAWDVGRAAWLAGAGFAVDLLSADAAWQIYARAAAAARAAFGSWEAFGASYLVGYDQFRRRRAAGDPDGAARAAEACERAVATLLAPGGRWATTPWDTPLDDDAAPVAPPPAPRPPRRPRPPAPAIAWCSRPATTTASTACAPSSSPPSSPARSASSGAVARRSGCAPPRSRCAACASRATAPASRSPAA